MLASSIEIPLQPQIVAQRSVAGLNLSSIQTEFAARYLEQVGVNPARENVELVLRKLPLQDALILPVWAKGSLVVLPGMAKRAKDGPNIIKEMFGVEDDDDGFPSFSNTQADAPANAMADNRDADAANSKEEAENAQHIEEINEHFKRTIGAGRRVSWCTVHTLDLLQPLVRGLPTLLMQDREFCDLAKPPIIEDNQIAGPLFKFVASIIDYVPRIKDDRTGRMYDSIKRMLQSDESARLYRLLTQYLYWNAIRRFAIDVATAAHQTHHFASIYESEMRRRVEADAAAEAEFRLHSAPGGMSARSGSLMSLDGLSNPDQGIEKEALFLQLEKAMHLVQQLAGYSKQSSMAGHQALVCCCHFVVDHLIEQLFPWFISWEKRASYGLEKKSSSRKLDLPLNQIRNMDGNDTGMQLSEIDAEIDILRLQSRRLFHQILADLLDPGRVFASTMLVSSLSGRTGIPLVKSKKASQFTTSMGVKTLFQDAKDASTRKILSHSRQTYSKLPALNQDLSPNKANLQSKANSPNKTYEKNVNDTANDLLQTLKTIRSKSKIDWNERTQSSSSEPADPQAIINARLGIKSPPKPPPPAPPQPLDFKNLFGTKEVAKPSKESEVKSNRNIDNKASSSRIHIDRIGSSNDSASSSLSLNYSLDQSLSQGQIKTQNPGASVLNADEKTQLMNLVVQRAQSHYGFRGKGKLPGNNNRIKMLGSQ